MMANCSDNVYVIKYTDKSKGTITIAKSSLVTNMVDIALVGKSRLDYGEAFNESMLHLLENFACPSLPGQRDTPDTLYAFGTLLVNPVTGQKWFNTTTKRLYIYDGDSIVPRWIPLARQGDVAGNSGIIAHGEFIPRPTTIDGYVFPYYECSFTVSQHSNRSIASDTYLPTNTEIDYVKCFVAQNGQVTMQFRYRGESSLRSGYANYQIIGIRDEVNDGPVLEVTPYPVPAATPGASSTPAVSPSATPASTATPTPTPTQTAAPGVTVTPTPTKTPAASVAQTPPPTLSATPTPTPTQTAAAGATPTPTPSYTPTRTPQPTVSPSSSVVVPVTPTTTPTPTPTVSVTKSVTPTPTVTPSATPAPSPTPSPVYSMSLGGIPTTLSDTMAFTPAFVRLTFNPNGTFEAKEHNTIVASGIYIPSGIGSNYEFYYTYDGEVVNDPVVGNYPASDPGPGAGAWINLGSSVSFYINDSIQATDEYVNITYSIRRVGNPTDVQTNTLFMDVDGGCFAVGTTLATANGTMNVEDLVVGTEMMSFDHAGMLDESDPNWRDWKTTDGTFTMKTSTVVDTYRFTRNGAIDINGIITTTNHIHFVFDGEAYGWKNACNVLATDKLVDADSNLVDIINITEIAGPVEFVALNVEDLDTLVIVNNDKLILGHNQSA